MSQSGSTSTEDGRNPIQSFSSFPLCLGSFSARCPGDPDEETLSLTSVSTGSVDSTPSVRRQADTCRSVGPVLPTTGHSTRPAYTQMEDLLGQLLRRGLVGGSPGLQF